MFDRSTIQFIDDHADEINSLSPDGYINLLTRAFAEIQPIQARLLAFHMFNKAFGLKYFEKVVKKEDSFSKSGDFRVFHEGQSIVIYKWAVHGGASEQEIDDTITSGLLRLPGWGESRDEVFRVVWNCKFTEPY